MEFEDYEDVFTFEEWSFQHHSSDGNDAKTFDELCEEVSYLCDKEVRIERGSLSNVRKVNSKSHEKTKVEHLHEVESEITNDTTPTSHMKLDMVCQSKSQDFAASAVQISNGFIVSVEKPENISQTFSTNNSTELVREEGGKAQCVDRKWQSKNCEDEVHLQEAMITTISEDESLSDNASQPICDSTAESEKLLQSSTETLEVKPNQTSPADVIVSREETKISISVDANGDNTQPRHSRSKEDICVTSKIETQQISCGVTASPNKNTRIEYEERSFINDSGISALKKKKSQKGMLDFVIKVDVNRELKNVYESNENELGITVSLADSNDNHFTYTSATNNVTSNLVSVNTLSLSEVSKPHCATHEVSNYLNDCESSEKLREEFSPSSSREEFSSSGTSHNSSLLLEETALSPSWRNDENSIIDFVSEGNTVIPSKKIISASDSEEISPEDSKLNCLKSEDVLSTENSNLNSKITEEVLTPDKSEPNNRDAGKEIYSNRDNCMETVVNIKKEKNQTFDSVSNTNNGEENSEISFSQRSHEENELEANVQLVELSNIKRESNAKQEAKNMKNKLISQRMRNDTNDDSSTQMLTISKESPRNLIESRKRRFRTKITRSQGVRTYSNKKRFGTQRESATDMNASYISHDEQNIHGDKSTSEDSKKMIITSGECASRVKLNAKGPANLVNPKLKIKEPENKFESVIEDANSKKLRDDSKKLQIKFSQSSAKESHNSPLIGCILPSKSDGEEQEAVVGRAGQGKEKNDNVDTTYLRATNTISLMDNSITSSIPSTSEMSSPEQSSSATIEINSKGKLKTMIDVKHNYISPAENTTSRIIHESNTSDEVRRIMPSRYRSAARTVPFSRNARSDFPLGPFRSTLDKTCSSEAVHRTKIRLSENEISVLSSQKSVSNDSDKIIVVGPDEQVGPVIQPKTYERKIIRFDYISSKVDNRDPRSRERVADPLTCRVNRTSRQFSVDIACERNIAIPKDEHSIPLPKKPKLESTEILCSGDTKSVNEPIIRMKKDDRNINPPERDSQEEIGSSTNLEIISRNRFKKHSVPSILITQEDKITEGANTCVLLRGENQCSINSSRIRKSVNVKDETSSNVSESVRKTHFCDSSCNDIFNDDTIKAICASEKTEISISLPFRSSESAKSANAECCRKCHHPRKTKVTVRRRSCDCGPEFDCSARKSRVDVLRSEAKFFKNSAPNNNVRTTKENNTTNQAALTWTDPHSSSQFVRNPFAKAPQTRESGQPDPPSAEGEKSARNKQVTTATTTVRRLRRTIVPLPFSSASSSPEVAPSASTSGRTLRQRILPPPAPPTA